jgi:SAM-dependent methyltransferase
VKVSASAASPLAALAPGSLAGYWRFQRAVARAQLAAWLPAPGKLLVDISGPDAGAPAQAADRGHRVIQVLAAAPPAAAPAAGPAPAPPSAPAASAPAAAEPVTAAPAAEPRRARPAGGRRGTIVPVVADPASLAFLADGCADGVIAEDGALSRQLMTEDLAAEIARVLRPGGQLLASVDSLVLGMAMLAEQHRWAHLTDLVHAEVVLIPWPDGTITRCFGVSQFTELLTEAGLEVSWVRPRTVLSPSMVDHVLRRDPSAITRLVRAELAACQDRAGGLIPAESFGISLLAAARKPPCLP